MESTALAQAPFDKNRYDLFTFPNQLQVLLIDDRNSKAVSVDSAIANVALSVNVGSYNEPEGRDGLAHFLEHMIFMGSSKYPNENEFS